MAKLTHFLSKIRNLTQENPWLSLTTSLAFFVLGWGATLGLDLVRDKIWPDSYQIEAQELREEINARTTTIEAYLNKLDPADTAAFEDTAQAILNELEALKPSVSQFAHQADQFAPKLADVKTRELRNLGVSAQADFILPFEGGVTLCDSRFSFALTRSNISGHVYLTLSKDGEQNGANKIAGQTLRLDVADRWVSVSYLGPAADGALSRFNFSCG
ncbi:MAG: hypothetical protein JXR15_01640 [Shimia sp.]|uniref:hypothetical protein n=1 Tax=Shimia sp. TaxID=1954381 RepID=UPI003B8E7A42